jgi:hypothetical protein
MTRFDQYRRDVHEALAAAMVPIEGGPLDGVLMLSADSASRVLAAVPVPPPDESEAELTEPATVHLRATCHVHGCGMTIPITGTIESYTKSRAKGGIAGMLLISSPVVHVCGQTVLPLTSPEAAGQTEAWDITGLTGPDVGSLGIERIRDVLGRVGVEVTAETVDGWTEPQREAAVQWAVGYHVSSGTDDEPTRPDHVPAPRDSYHSDLPEGETDGGLPEGTPPDVAGEPDACPYAGCTLYAEHKGDHVDAHGAAIKGRGRKARTPKPSPANDPAPEDPTERPDVPDAFRDALPDDPDLLPE